MAGSDDSTLIQVAVFCITVSIVATAVTSLVLTDPNGDYDYNTIQDYRDDLITFSGESMINNSPWVLTDVYTPWQTNLGYDGHVDKDDWLFGDRIEYEHIGKSANIRLDPDKKSSSVISVDENNYEVDIAEGYQWWSIKAHSYGGIWGDIKKSFYGYTTLVGSLLGQDGQKYRSVNASNWNFTGYRYVFDPTLPFKYADSSSADGDGDVNLKTSTRDGSLSLVWYDFNGQEGLSGGLVVYGGRVVLGQYSALEIVADYQSNSGYATTYDFDFEGTHLDLSIRFDESAIAGGTSLLQAWSDGHWSMAISSKSAGNFYDIENSTSFTTTAGGMIDTFIKIFTFNLPQFQNTWASLLLWLICGLPMCLCMAIVTLRIVQSVKPF